MICFRAGLASDRRSSRLLMSLFAGHGGDLAVFPRDARQHGNGAGQIGSADRRALCLLVEDRELSATLFGRIRDGWQAATTHCWRLRSRHGFWKKPALDTSIRLRLPYIEPLNLLQVELLKRYRSGEHDPRVKEGIHLSINAIATALRNSG